MARPRGLPKTGGRKAGTQNKATAPVRALAQEYTEPAVLVLAEVLQDRAAPHMARIRAAEALLDRGHGRPGQYIEARISPLEGLSDEDLAAAAAALRAAIAAEHA